MGDNEQRVTMSENRDLRECVRDITSGCFLTRDEYYTIMGIIKNAVLREVDETA